MANGTIITDLGDKLILNQSFGNGTRNQPSYFKISSDSTTYTKSSTSLTNPLPIAGEEEVDTCETANWTESTDALAETVNSTAGQYKRGNGCLNLGKDGTASADANYEKTQASTYDGTNKKLNVWVYTADTTDLATTDAIVLRIGSDSTNYYQQTWDAADLSNGWNFLVLDIENPESTNNSPTKTALDYCRIAFTTTATSTTITSGDWRMDHWHLTSTDDYKKNNTSMTVDESTKKATIICDLGSTDLNGHNFNVIGVFNSDDELLIIGTMTQDSKSTTDLFKLKFELARPT